MNHPTRTLSLIFALIIILIWVIPSNPRLTPAGTGPNSDTLDDIKRRGYLLWGSDAEGGAPYVFPDPKDPSRLIGFEVDLAEAIAKELGVKARQFQNAWDSLIPALIRGDFDIALNGIEITAQRAERVLFSRPYYVYTEQLVVRKDETRVKGLDDLIKGAGITIFLSVVASVIAMVELTKTYSILAATTLRFFELGLIVALLYFAMSYPLSLLARGLEARLKGWQR